MAEALTGRPPGGRAAAALLAVLAACAGADSRRAPELPAEQVPEPERYGGTAVVAVSVDAATFNPLWSLPEPMWVHQGLLSMPLFRYDAERRLEPWLAERWDTVRVAPDSLELTLHLRRDVRWHDGAPTTAEDVRFTYGLMMDPATGFAGRDFLERWWGSAVVVDSFTVRFRLRPHAEFLDFWAWHVPLPAHLLRDVSASELPTHRYGQQPVGNGPFRFVRRVPAQEWVFEANPDFPEALGGRPYLDRVVFRIIPDATARITDLLTGGVDFGFVPAEQFARLESAPGVRLVEAPDLSWAQIAWNTRRPPFDDVRVRRALSLAIDRQEIVDGLLGGRAVPGRWTVTPGQWQFAASDPGADPRARPDAARQLLAEAGWHDRDGDGILDDATGRPLRFTLMTYRESSTYTDILPLIQAQLRRIGVDVRTRIVEGATSWDIVQGRPDGRGGRVRDYDAFLTWWEVGTNPDDTGMLHSRLRDAPHAITGYANPRADTMMERLAVTVDPAQARELWREYQRFMIDEAPITVLYYPRSMVAVAERLQDVERTWSYATAARWWIAPGQRRRGPGGPQ